MNSRSKLSEDSLGFFRRVSSELDNDESEVVDDEFYANVFDYTFKNNQLKLSRDKVVCCILEKALRLAPAAHVQEFLSNTVEYLERYVSDKYASHVVQTSLNQCLRMTRSQMAAVNVNEESDSPDSLVDIVVKIGSGIVGKLNDFVFDTYGSHVVCSLIQVISGVRVGDDIVRSRVSQKVAQKKTGAAKDKLGAVSGAETVWGELPEELNNELDSFCDAFVSMRDFSHCLTDRSASKVLQALLYCTQRRDENRCKHLCRQVLTACKVLSAQADDGTPAAAAAAAACNTGGASAITRLAEDSVASHGLECILKVASPKLVQRLCQQCFSGQLLTMSLHHSANYVVQKLCDALSTENQMLLVAGELLPYLEDVLAMCHFGVCIALVKAASRVACQQAEVVEALLTAFHATAQPERCCHAFLALSALDAVDASEEGNKEEGSANDSSATASTDDKASSLTICPQGCQLVTGLLSMADPVAVLDSIVALSSDDLVRLATEQAGSRVFDAFYECAGAGSKRKRKIVKKLKGHFVQLACHKVGSYVVDACYRNSKSKSRQEMAEELLAEEHKLRESFFGKHVIRNCELSDLKMNSFATPAKHTNKKRVYSDTVDGDAQLTSPPAKKKAKKEKGG
eukprot:scpid42481/ scgid32491/ Pumilio domain-containing protein C14orf21